MAEAEGMSDLAPAADGLGNEAWQRARRLALERQAEERRN